MSQSQQEVEFTEHSFSTTADYSCSFLFWSELFDNCSTEFNWTFLKKFGNEFVANGMPDQISSRLFITDKFMSVHSSFLLQWCTVNLRPCDLPKYFVIAILISTTPPNNKRLLRVDPSKIGCECTSRLANARNCDYAKCFLSLQIAPCDCKIACDCDCSVSRV